MDTFLTGYLPVGLSFKEMPDKPPPLHLRQIAAL